MVRKHFTCQQICKQFDNISFNTWFSFTWININYLTSSSRQLNLLKSSYRTNRYGEHSIIAIVVYLWNKIQKQLKNKLLKDLSPKNINIVVGNCYLKSY